MPSTATSSKTSAKANIFARMALFVRQIIGELRKVTTPTRNELVRYVMVVILFVAIMIGIATVLDLGFGSLANLVFGGGSGDN